MFIDFISRILGAEKVSVSNRLENNAEPSVIVTKDSNRPIPEKYKKDVASLRRERRRIDSYRGLQSYLKKDWNITLTIKSQKTKSKEL